MATVFGKVLRKIRINRDELLMDMAQKLTITPAYLSSIENGKRSIPQNMSTKIISLYDLTPNEVEALYAAEDETRNRIEFDFSDVDYNKKSMVLALARSFDKISETQLKEIREILDKRKE